jgi:hypothetical protein
VSGGVYGAPISNLAELDALDTEELLEGYRDGLNNEPEPSGNRSRSYWHGWRNGMVDKGHRKGDAAQAELARQFVERSVLS